MRGMRAAGLAVVLCGCNAIFGLDRTHLSADAPSSVADASPPDAHLFDANPADLDGDGISNVNDDCPNAFDPDQADEDGDTFGDVCDDCPELYNLDQKNDGETKAGVTADAIGDACDPNPATSGDERVLFEPFNDPSHLTAWKTPLGTWSISGGTLHQLDTNVATALAYYDTAIQPTTITVLGKVEAFGISTQKAVAAGAWIAMQAPNAIGDGFYPDGYLCEVTQTEPPQPTGAAAQVLAYANNVSYTSSAGATNHTLIVGDGVSLYAQVASATPTVRCTPVVPGAGVGLSLADTKYTGGVVGLHTAYLGVEFSSVTIYAR